MNNDGFVKGSEWRKWDLHIHAPSSALNNQFKGKDNEEKWEKYIEKLEELQDISVLGITDYFSIKGYKKVMEYKTKGRLKNIDLILPNTEFRLLPVTRKGKGINYHIIFSSKIVDKLERLFFSQLKFSYGGSIYNCTEDQIIDLGRAFNGNKNLDTEKAYEIGIEQFNVDINDIIDIFNQNKELYDNAIRVVGNSSGDGASGLQHDNSLKGIRENIYKFSDAIFSGQPSDRNFFTGEKTSEQEVIKQCGSLKPCIHGSDAHKLDKICKPDEDRFTWIKADPTFEGFRQIIIEPKNRVRIQQEKPELKKAYNIIDSVQFIDKSDKLIFPSHKIELNPNLNSIVGGKSSGKSLLLYYMAKTIIPKDIESMDIKDYNFEEIYGDKFDFVINWKDGEVQKLSSKEKNRTITYIPQMYLNKLVEDKKDNLQEKILDTLLQNEDLENEYKMFKEEKGKIEQRICENIKDLFDSIEESGLIAKKVINIGDMEAIKKEINNLEKEIESIKNNCGFLEKETIEFERLSNEEEKCYKIIEKLENKIKLLVDFKEFYEKLASDTIPNLIKEKYNSKNHLIQELGLKEHLDTIKGKFMNAINMDYNSIFDEISELSEDVKFLEDKISIIKNKMVPYINKMDNKKIFDKRNIELKEQQYLLKNIETLKKEEEIQERIIGNSIKNLLEYTKNMNEIFEKMKERFIQKYQIEKMNNIDLKIEIEFNNDQFEKNFINKINRKVKLPDIFGDNIFSEEEEFIYDKENIESTYESVLYTIFKKDIKLKKMASKKDLIEALFKTNIKFTYDLVQNGDKLLDMSPGKRGIVLFQLYLQLDNSKSPILIDQPEDNLDNRTVFKELKDFIIKKKEDRQIIIITHNANLVVPTDSEEVIIANQSGQEQKRENRRYRFEYVSGSLENEFDDETKQGILYKKGIKNHVCEILEGGKEAFIMRNKKYRLIESK
ncbi:TrlF family AAA-like ATPase [Clostridium botulinum]|uniref:TrlF family AAA-like ATPase n=1 Tax=Clostridium botulinum TaxID=1491 RepID=UPI003DA265FE